MEGQVTDYNSSSGKGTVQDSKGMRDEHPFRGSDCSSNLITALGNNGPPINVTYEIAGTGWAISLDLAPSIDIAASAEN